MENKTHRFVLIASQEVFDEDFQTNFEYKKPQKSFKPKFYLETIDNENLEENQKENENLWNENGINTILVVIGLLVISNNIAIAVSLWELLKFDKNRSWKTWLASSGEYLSETFDNEWDPKTKFYFFLFGITGNILGIGANLLEDHWRMKYTLPSLERTPIELLIPTSLPESKHLRFAPQGFLPAIDYGLIIGKYLLPILVRFIIEVGVENGSQPYCNVRNLLELLTDSNIMTTRLKEGLEKRTLKYYEPNNLEYQEVIAKLSELLKTGVPLILDYCKYNPPVTKVKFNFTE
jgi:hypothetical protein